MRVCIVGGGTAGWMTAAALSKKFQHVFSELTLVESEAIGTVGVGEATLPHIRFFNQGLGIDEAEFMRFTQATFKLGIEFCDWGQIGQRYIHPFGDFGLPLNGTSFYQLWLKMKDELQLGSLDEFAYGIALARKEKFNLPELGDNEVSRAFGYAYQFDSGLYAKFLRNYSEKRGVRRVEGKINKVCGDKQNHQISTLYLDNGIQLEADLFIDCSGFRGLLIEQFLESGYQDWSSWLPCNRALAVPCERQSELAPYTRATARKAGWQWRIPLQHRTGNGLVFWDEFISEDEATTTLLNNLDGAALSEPKPLFFKTGRRNHFWRGNVVAIGLSAGFLEPLESTSIHLIQEGITQLLELFPNSTVTDFEQQEYNSRMSLQYERIRDFLLLHYVATQRTDSDMWRYFANMTLPDSLQEKIDLWMQRAYIQRYEFGAFLPPSWIAVMVGQNLIPHSYDQRVDAFDPKRIHQHIVRFQNMTRTSLDKSQQHEAFIRGIQASSNTPIMRAV